MVTIKPARHAAIPRHRLALRVVAAAVTSGLVLAAGGAVVAYQRLEGNLTARDVGHQLGPDRPTAPPADEGEERPVNILVIGSDTRATAGGRYGEDVYGARSDSTLLVHLSGDRRRAEVVSIPRDSAVDIPTCWTDEGHALAPVRARFNEAFARGGPACTQRTVEQLTSVRVDHYVLVDFAAFEAMVDALDGVEVCLPHAVRDPQSHLDLPAGRQEVRGEDALAYARLRHNIADGSDLSRIDRQQALMSAMVQKVQSAGVLLRPDRLFAFLDAATGSLTTDPALASLERLRGLATSAQAMDRDAISFLTVPYVQDPRNPASTVVWDEPRAGQLWAALREDLPVPGTEAARRAEARAGARATAAAPGDGEPLRTPPGDVRVRVLNGSGVSGAAQAAADDLSAAGFVVVGFGNADGPAPATAVRRSPDYDESGRTLLAAVPGAREEVDPALGRTLEVVLGPDFAGVAALDPGRFGGTAGDASAVPASTPAFQARSAAGDICS